MAKEAIKTVVQIEHIDANELVNRFDNLENTLRNFMQLQGQNKQLQQQDEYITRNEIAKLFKISLMTVHDWTKKGILQSYKIGNRVLYKKHEVENSIVKINSNNVPS